MAYRVKELFHTLQGEGINAGRPAVFCRFSGCNLWSGREAQRSSATCRFCDTDFVGTDGEGGGTFEAGELASRAAELWLGATGVPPGRAPASEPEDATGSRALLVCTGGEPLLQLDADAVDAFHRAGFEVAVETNGTIPLPPGVDWVCVSPKANSEVVVRSGDELKLVYPQEGAEPGRFEGGEWNFTHRVLQPMDGEDLEANTLAAARYCMAHPRWRLGIQTHKVIGIP
ncbi:MAG: 7-carboxy-7-deazaguanine synthase [Microthrixaceae bacterium]|nr:7-carboxy-7-deazaguanine synthase [Microthrixaceae bacterium]